VLMYKKKLATPKPVTCKSIIWLFDR
jgi:hypothetical protein